MSDYTSKYTREEIEEKLQDLHDRTEDANIKGIHVDDDEVDKKTRLQWRAGELKGEDLYPITHDKCVIDASNVDAEDFLGDLDVDLGVTKEDIIREIEEDLKGKFPTLDDRGKIPDEFLPEGNQGTIIVPEDSLLITQSKGQNDSIVMSQKAVTDELDKINETLNKAVQPEGYQILYTTYNNEAIKIPDSGVGVEDEVFSGVTKHIESNEYYPSRGFGIITLNCDVVPSFLLHGQPNLKTVTVSGAFRAIGGFGIANNANLLELHLENGIKHIGFKEQSDIDKYLNTDEDANYAPLCHNTSLRDLVIPDSVDFMRPMALYNCKSLGSVKLSENLTELDMTFWECTSLTMVKLPSKLKTLSGNVFWHCESLSSIFIPDSVTSMSANTFFNCRNLRFVRLSTNLKGTLDATFLACSIQELFIPEGITRVNALFGNDTTPDLHIVNRVSYPASLTELGTTWKEFARIIEIRGNFINVNFPWPHCLEELWLKANKVVTGVDDYFNQKISFTTTADMLNCLNGKYDGQIRPFTKIYVPGDLLEDYKTTYPDLKNHFYPITGEDTFAFKDDLLTVYEDDFQVKEMFIEDGEDIEIYTKDQIDEQLEITPYAEKYIGEVEEVVGVTREDLEKDLFIKLWNDACKVHTGTWYTLGKYNYETDYFELNGLTDITFDEAVEIFNFGRIDISDATSLRYSDSRIRTHLPPLMGYSTANFDRLFRASTVEVVNSNRIVPSIACFSGCTKLRKANLYSINSQVGYKTGVYTSCSILEDIDFSVVFNFNIDLPDSPLLSFETFQRIVEKKTGDTSIVVTIHPDIYYIKFGASKYFFRDNLVSTANNNSVCKGLITPGHSESWNPHSNLIEFSTDDIGKIYWVNLTASDTGDKYHFIGTLTRIESTNRPYFKTIYGSTGHVEFDDTQSDQWQALNELAISKNITFATV